MSHITPPPGSFVSPLVPTAVKTSAYTAAANDLVPVDTTSGAVTITLPTAPADKTRVAVKHVIQGGVNAVTVACGGSDVFNKTSGGTTLTLSLVNQAVTLQYKASGAIWYVVTDDLSLASLNGAFAPILTPQETITYNSDGTVATQVIGGVTTTYTYNVDGTVATETRAGVTRTYSYTAGQLTGVA